MLESQIEYAVCQYAKSLGWSNSKCIGSLGDPDRFFRRYCKKCPSGLGVYIEFKAAGGKLSVVQKLRIKKIKSEGFRVFIVRSIQEGEDVFKELEQEYFNS